MKSPDYNTLYEFERLLSQTGEGLFNSAEIKTIGAAKAADDLQKDRPRVDVFVTVGAALDHFVVTPDGFRRENGWHATLQLTCITEADFILHSKYIAAVRELASRLDRLDLANPAEAEPTLDYHEITQARSAGTTSQVKPETGVYETALNYEILFAIRSDAWPDGINTVQPLT